jgi:hypothetical protein
VRSVARCVVAAKRRLCLDQASRLDILSWGKNFDCVPVTFAPMTPKYTVILEAEPTGGFNPEPAME